MLCRRRFNPVVVEKLFLGSFTPVGKYFSCDEILCVPPVVVLWRSALALWLESGLWLGWATAIFLFSLLLDSSGDVKTIV